MTFGGNQLNDVGKALAAAVSETVNFVIRHSAGVDKELATETRNYADISPNSYS